MKVRFERWLVKFLGLKRVQLEVPGPAVMDLPVGELLTTAIARFGCYEKETVHRVLELLRVNKYFLDVGGHFGQYTVAAAAALMPGGYVVTVEPSPQNYLELLGNIRLNRNRNVYPVLAAAAGSDGLLALEPGENSSSSRTTETVVGGVTLVPAIRLVDLVRRLGIPRIDVVKMDVEGSEPKTLDGLLADGLPLPRHIIFEYVPHRFPSGREVAARLQRIGYTLRQVTGAPFHADQKPVNDNVWAELDQETPCCTGR
jgi:FkbM family methyltransferase